MAGQELLILRFYALNYIFSPGYYECLPLLFYLILLLKNLNTLSVIVKERKSLRQIKTTNKRLLIKRGQSKSTRIRNTPRSDMHINYIEYSLLKAPAPAFYAAIGGICERNSANKAKIATQKDQPRYRGVASIFIIVLPSF